MVTKNEIRFPIFRAVHPGEILAEELRERKIKQKELAQAIGMQPSHLNEILKGKRALTPVVADKIEAELGVASVELVNMQNQYDYDTRHLQGMGTGPEQDDAPMKTSPRPSVRDKLGDLSLRISWLPIARPYFGKSPSWLYHKLNGVGGQTFTDEEKDTLRTALLDLSDRLRAAAGSL